MSKEACEYLNTKINEHITFCQDQFKMTNTEILGVLMIIQSEILIKGVDDEDNSFRA